MRSGYKERNGEFGLRMEDGRVSDGSLRINASVS